jgi:hypothetical protein
MQCIPHHIAHPSFKGVFHAQGKIQATLGMIIGQVRLTPNVRWPGVRVIRVLPIVWTDSRSRMPTGREFGGELVRHGQSQKKRKKRKEKQKENPLIPGNTINALA